MKIFTLFNIPVYIHWSWFILVAFFAFQSLGHVIALLLTFTVVVMHEYGHCIAAKYVKVPVKDIILFPLGGMARIYMPKSITPGKELLISVGGPLVNLVLIILLLAYGHFASMSIESFKTGSDLPIVPLLWVFLLAINILLLGFNLIPAYPMDGGRIVKSIVSMFVEDRQKATFYVVRFSQGLSVCLCVAAVYFGFFMPALIFAVMPFLAQQELNQTKFTGNLDALKAKIALMVNKPEIADLPLSEFIAALEAVDEETKKRLELNEIIEILREVESE